MARLEEDIETLCAFGLSQHQARVYLAILRLDLPTVSQISKVAKLRREDVYRSLPLFEKMGLTERLLGTPTKVRAISSEEAFAALLKREEEASKRTGC